MKEIPLAISRYLKAHNFKIEDIKDWAAISNFDGYRISFNDYTVIQIYGPVLMRYED